MFLPMTAEDDAVHDEQKNPSVTEECEANEEGEDSADDHSRSRIGVIQLSATRMVPNVCTCFTVP